MAKVINLSQITPNLPFSEFDFYHYYMSTFPDTELGRMHALIPFKQLVKNFGLTRHGKHTSGRKPFFTPEGKIALAFLLMYTGLSAPKLMEQLNANIHYQIFCGVRIDPTNPMRNYKVIDEVMAELASHLKVQTAQLSLAPPPSTASHGKVPTSKPSTPSLSPWTSMKIIKSS